MSHTICTRNDHRPSLLNHCIIFLFLNSIKQRTAQCGCLCRCGCQCGCRSAGRLPMSTVIECNSKPRDMRVFVPCLFRHNSLLLLLIAHPTINSDFVPNLIIPSKLRSLSIHYSILIVNYE